MSELFSIGDMARMFNISTGSLRHYEQLGLLTPERIDENTGYRYYSTRQFEVINTIRYLRTLDMPLTVISEFLKNRSADSIRKKLLHQKQTVMQKLDELKRIERKIDNRLHMLDIAENSQPGVILREQMPACRMVWLDGTLNINGAPDIEAPIRKLEESQNEALIFLGKIGLGISAQHLYSGCYNQYDGIFLLLDKEDSFDGKTLRLPKSECVLLRFCGSHPQAAEYYEKLMRYIRENGLEINGFSREITMIDYGITNDTDKFVTEIAIPVKSADGN